MTETKKLFLVICNSIRMSTAPQVKYFHFICKLLVTECNHAPTSIPIVRRVCDPCPIIPRCQDSVRCYRGWSGDNNLFSVYLLCCPPPLGGRVVWPRCDQTLMITLSLRSVGAVRGRTLGHQPLMMHLRKVPSIVLNTTLLGLFAMRTGRHGMGVDLASLSTTNECEKWKQ